MNPHGTYEIFLSGNVLRVVAVGPFNAQALVDYGEAYESVVELLPSGPWAVLGIFEGESLFIPEAEDKLVEITRWRIQNQMRAVALVLRSSTAEAIVKEQISRIYRRAGAYFATFEVETEALEWLSAEGFEYEATRAVRHRSLGLD